MIPMIELSRNPLPLPPHTFWVRLLLYLLFSELFTFPTARLIILPIFRADLETMSKIRVIFFLK